MSKPIEVYPGARDELGKKAERHLWDENRHPNLTPLEDILGARIQRGKRDRKWSDAQQAIETATLRRLSAPVYENAHMGGRPCLDPFCEPCEQGTKRLLRDVGVLP